jgi:RHS repeat-associated protein
MPVNRGIWVVSSLQRDNGTAPAPLGTTTFTYQYRDGRADVSGLGWLGFGGTTVTNKTTGEVIDTTYHSFERFDEAAVPSYPLQGLADTTTHTWTVAPNHFIQKTVKSSYSITTLSVGDAIINIPQVRFTQRIALDRETGSAGQLQTKSRRTETWSNFDDFGNPQNKTDQVSQWDQTGTLGEADAPDQTPDHLSLIHDESTTTQYQNDSSAWIYGLPTNVSVQKRAHGDVAETVTQTVAYTYEPGTAQIATTTVQPGGDSDTNLVTTFTRANPHGLVTQIVKQDKAGATRTLAIGYDPVWNLFAEKITRGDNLPGHVAITSTSRTYPALGVMAETTDPNGVTTHNRYDTFGRIKTITSDQAGTTTFTYSNPSGSSQMIEVAPTGRPMVKIWLDTLEREVVRETQEFDASDNAGWSSVSTDYNAAGLLWRVSRPQSEHIVVPPPGFPTDLGDWKYTSYGYDGAQRLTSIQLPGEPPRYSFPTHAATVGGHINRTYSWLTVTDTKLNLPTDQMAQSISSETYDALGRTLATSTTDPKQLDHVVTTNFHYGALSAVKTIDGAGNSVTMTYDALGRRTLYQDTETTSHSYYNAFGEVRREETPLGALAVVPDNLGRPVTLTGPEGQSKVWWDIAAMGIGKRAFTQSPDGIINGFAYDSVGRPQEESWILGGSTLAQIDTDYDAAGRPQFVTYKTPEQQVMKVTRGYSASGYLASVTASDPSLAWSVLRRSPAGLPTWETFGTGTPDSIITTTRSYFNRGGISSLQTFAGTNYAGPFLQDQSYDYDGLGRVTSAGEETYSYDFMNRLESWTHWTPDFKTWTETYGYDDLGNLTSKGLKSSTFSGTETDVFRYGENGAGPHQMTTAPWGAGSAFQYDANGNQKAAPDRSAVFTSFNLPSSVTANGVTTSFLYDFDHRRIRKSTPGLTIDTFGGLYERRTSNGQVTNVFYVDGDVSPIAQVIVDAAGQKHVQYIHGNDLGSASVLTDEAGNDIGHQTFDPWGQRLAYAPSGQPTSTSTTIAGLRVGFTGHEQDDEMGLINMRGRVYDPRQRRFISPDPLVTDPLFGQAYNPYSYVLNNPTNFVDPSGFAGELDPSGPMEDSPTPQPLPPNQEPPTNDWTPPTTQAPPNDPLQLRASEQGSSSSQPWPSAGTATEPTPTVAAPAPGSASPGGPSPATGGDSTSNVNVDGGGNARPATAPAWTNVIPVAGPFQKAVIDAANGHYGWAVVNSFACAIDIVAFAPNVAWSLVRGLLMAEAKNIAAGAVEEAAAAGRAGSGPPGMVEVSAGVKSVNYVKNFSGPVPVDFTFDYENGVFRMGNHELGHPGLAGGSDSAVGGTIWRGNGTLRTNEHSGRLGQNWTPAIADKFVDFMRSFGIDVVHTATW